MHTDMKRQVHWLGKGAISLCVLCALVLFAAQLARGGEKQCAVLGPDDAVKVAFKKNPMLAAKARAVKVQRERIIPAGALPDPVLGLSILNLPVDTFDFQQEAMTQTQLRISQRLPFPGKLSLKRSLQEKRTQMASLGVKEFGLRLSAKVKSAWWDLYMLRYTLDLVKREKETLERIIGLSTDRYEAGEGIQSDVLLAQLELTRLLKRRIDLEKRYKEVQAGLSVLLGEPGTCIETRAPVSMEFRQDLDTERLIKEALEKNPGILLEKKRLELKRVDYRLKKRDVYPDFMLTGAYGKRFGENPNGSSRADFATFMFQLNIPIFYKTKQRGEILSALEGIGGAEEKVKGKVDEVKGGINEEVSTYEGYVREVRLFEKEILPMARQSLDALKISYASGRADILGLLKAELMLYRYEEDYIKAVAGAKKALSRLEALVGSALETMP